MLFSYGQEVVEKKIISKAGTIVIEFGMIDHIELLNSSEDNSVRVRAEGSVLPPGFDIDEKEGHVLIRDHVVPDLNEFVNDASVCIEAPDYPSYKISIPQNRALYVSFLEGNFYTEKFEGDLNLKVENGIIKITEMRHPVKVRLHTGRVFVKNIRDTKIDAETSLGVLVNNVSDTDAGSSNSKLFETIGRPTNSIMIRSIMANIYLYRSED